MEVGEREEVVEECWVWSECQTGAWTESRCDVCEECIRRGVVRVVKEMG